jgi:hypothetical protein
VQRATGEHAAVTASHQQALQLYRVIGYRVGEARALTALGAVLQAIEDYPAAAASLAAAQELYDQIGIEIDESYNGPH